MTSSESTSVRKTTDITYVAVGYRLFTLKTYSTSSSSGYGVNGSVTVQGLAYDFGSLIVIATSIWPKSFRWNRSVTCNASEPGIPALSIQFLSGNPSVSTTNVSASQRPIE